MLALVECPKIRKGMLNVNSTKYIYKKTSKHKDEVLFLLNIYQMIRQFCIFIVQFIYQIITKIKKSNN